MIRVRALGIVALVAGLFLAMSALSGTAGAGGEKAADPTNVAPPRGLPVRGPPGTVPVPPRAIDPAPPVGLPIVPQEILGSSHGPSGNPRTSIDVIPEAINPLSRRMPGGVGIAIDPIFPTHGVAHSIGITPMPIAENSTYQPVYEII